MVRPSGRLAPADGEVLKLLLNAEALDVVDSEWQPDRGTPVAANSLGELFLPLAGLVDYAAERNRLEKEIEKVRAEVLKVQEKLANPAFTSKVPPKVLDEHQARLKDWQAKETQMLALSIRSVCPYRIHPEINKRKYNEHKNWCSDKTA